MALIQVLADRYLVFTQNVYGLAYSKVALSESAVLE